MRMHRLSTPGLAIFTYVLVDQATNRCAVVDPTRDVEPILTLAREEELEITDIFETHVHADFLSGAKELKHRLGGSPTIHCSSMGGEQWTPKYADHLLKDRDAISVGSIRIEAWHTPGHSSEHITYLIFDETRDTHHPCTALTGDFLFVGSVGRPDLLGENALKILSRQLYHSITNILPQLPAYVEIFPGHGAGSMCGKAISGMDSSTIGYEQQTNPFLHAATEKEWTENLLAHSPRTPSYFARMKKLNVTGPALLAEIAPPRLLSTAELLAPKASIIVDLRPPEEFTAGFLPGSLNIPLSLSTAMWCGEFIPPETEVILVGSTEDQVHSATTLLHLIGLDHIVGYAIFTEAVLNELQGHLKRSIPIEPQAAAANPACVVDVRSQEEWDAGHIEGALHIDLGSLPAQLSTIPRDQTIYTVCGLGQRASIAASMLRREGFNNVLSILGGMYSWEDQKLPVSTPSSARKP